MTILTIIRLNPTLNLILAGPGFRPAQLTDCKIQLSKLCFCCYYDSSAVCLLTQTHRGVATAKLWRPSMRRQQNCSRRRDPRSDWPKSTPQLSRNSRRSSRSLATRRSSSFAEPTRIRLSLRPDGWRRTLWRGSKRRRDLQPKVLTPWKQPRRWLPTTKWSSSDSSR